MAIQRPGRPTTRLGQPAVKATPAKPAPPSRAAAPAPKAPAPAPTRGRSPGPPTRSVQKQSSSRPVPKQAAKSGTPMIIGIVAAVVVVAGIAAFAMSGNSQKVVNSPPKESSKPKAVDVSGLERDGMTKCDQGLAIIKKCESQIGSASLSDSEKMRLKADLEQATGLLRDGMSMLDEANRKSGNTYPISQYIEAKKVARMKLGELGGK